MYKFISKCENDTINFACKLAKLLKSGDIIVLSGDLGSGKTKFTQGILKYFELENEISSPTFTIVNEYHKNTTNIYHFDVYRLSDSDEFYAIGGDEYLNNGICIIEWGEIIEDILPKDYIKISFSKDNNAENCRILELVANGQRSESILKNIE
ncbi:MAG: tRNA (adenosine(37)-N6)-threonylcarbamoyltransferase complex ATPase subunit type 1 TsaE [Clostridia bacterium]|nr:tRNA (adenosine(37)-N6)-threonylcarbamoyltransferase complex ATPase subunit type 1 TsaE [Clostridia bacterium]